MLYCGVVSDSLTLVLRLVLQFFSEYPVMGVQCALALTGQFAEKPTRSLSSRGLVNSQTSQLADTEFFKIMELLYFVCTLNLTQTLKNYAIFDN